MFTQLNARRVLTRLVAIVATTAGLAAGATAVAPTASAATPAALGIHGDMVIGNFHSLRIDAVGVRTATGNTTGTYRAQVLNGSGPIGVEFLGPVTCIYVRGNVASLVYPIRAVVPLGEPGGLTNAYAIQVTVRKGPNNRGSKVGLMGPLPTNSFRGCSPAATPFAFVGTIVTYGG
ncbi:hypothetical protein GOEFS_073_00300 [Gordonia effusa NBRC 100432]|uniref:Uncharacterized protein n=1 Tax=Gordonia effusa NBRC 100432 TaxID=1077974 RepID=H0R1Q9_9ACTN|nr:hypothetical protein [Gordonia effusa]GAB19010.1 hypothetical protein GOEFS_073_00300 [Gordonia effusa NBRC 100432]